MKVIAAKGLKCPKEGKPREYITDTESVDVPEGSTYYRRLINDGSLVLAQQSSRAVEQKSEQKTIEQKSIEKDKGGRR